MTLLCKCHSGKIYSVCCQPFHTGRQIPQNAVELMRSRYSAYANMLIGYLIETTHLKNGLFKNNMSQVRDGLMQFAASTTFDNLTIVHFIDGESEAWVTFIATLSQNGQDASFQEKSRFLKVNGKWLYHSGITT